MNDETQCPEKVETKLKAAAGERPQARASLGVDDDRLLSGAIDRRDRALRLTGFFAQIEHDLGTANLPRKGFHP